MPHIAVEQIQCLLLSPPILRILPQPQLVPMVMAISPCQHRQALPFHLVPLVLVIGSSLISTRTRGVQDPIHQQRQLHTRHIMWWCIPRWWIQGTLLNMIALQTPLLLHPVPVVMVVSQRQLRQALPFHLVPLVLVIGSGLSPVLMSLWWGK